MRTCRRPRMRRDRHADVVLQLAGAENLIKEAKNDAGMADHPSGRWAMNCIFFQFAMLAYNRNCWLMLFHREEEAPVETLGHTTLATARLRFLFLAARIWRRVAAARFLLCKPGVPARSRRRCSTPLAIPSLRLEKTRSCRSSAEI
jgi:hypothetical protein